MHIYKDTKEIYCDTCFVKRVIQLTAGPMGSLNHLIASRKINLFDRLFTSKNIVCKMCNKTNDKQSGGK